MKSHLLLSPVFSLAALVVGTAGMGNAEADSVSTGTANFFNGETVNASSNYGGYLDVTSADPSVLVDQKATPGFATNELGPIEEINYFSFSGSTTTTGIDTINLFDCPAWSSYPGGPREASSVAVYYLTSDTGSLSSAQLLDPANYTSVGSFTLTFSNTTSGTDNQDASGQNVNYQTLSLNIPAGTTSVLLGFTKSVDNGNIYGPPYDYYHGFGLTEVQAFQTAVVPEPSTYLFLLSGLGMLFVNLRRRAS